jgi:hypothetical protein
MDGKHALLPAREMLAEGEGSAGKGPLLSPLDTGFRSCKVCKRALLRIGRSRYYFSMPLGRFPIRWSVGEAECEV